MNSILRHNLAPLSDQAWDEINESARDVLNSQLSARSLVDFIGPKGMDFSAINLGRIKIEEQATTEGIQWGIRQLLPLLEIRMPFELKQLEVDDINRGAKNADMEPLEKAAQAVAHFEDSAIYNGFEQAGIKGIIPSSDHEPVTFPKETEKILPTVTEGVQSIVKSGIKGSFALVLGDSAYQILMRANTHQNHSLTESLEDLLGGPIKWSPALDGGVLLSTRGGDFEMTVGQDLSIGYAAHDKDVIELYFTESFTFQVIESAAAVPITM